jgi:hypothetical protein
MITEQEQKYPKVFIKTNVDLTIVVKDRREDYTPLITKLIDNGVFLGYRAMENDEIYVVNGKIIEVIFSQQFIKKS